MNITPKRLGNGNGAPRTRIDSSHGSAMTTPAPRSTDRRDMVRTKVPGTPFCGRSVSDMCSGPSLVSWVERHDDWPAPVEELRAGHDCLDQRIELIAGCPHPRLHVRNDRIIGQLERAAKRIRQQLAADVFEEVLLPLRLDVGLD